MKLAPRLLLAGSAVLLPAGCVAVEPEPDAITLEAAQQIDDFVRLKQAVDRLETEDPMLAMNRLERLMIGWERQQRAANEEPLELVLTAAVVRHFDTLVTMLVDGPLNRRIVAAWALGFSTVPPNDLGVPMRQAEAVTALVDAIEQAPDAVLQNIMIALWRLGDATTPLVPILDIMVNHHDPLARANATLALVTILQEDSASAAQGAVLVALEDQDPKVRLHAASVAKRFPSAAYTSHIEQLILAEKEALVRANMALALGAGRKPSSARYLVPLLDSPRRDASDARRALIVIFGEDHGPNADDWRHLVR